MVLVVERDDRSVLGAEVGEDLGVGFVAEPKVVVDALVLMDGDILGLLGGDGRLGVDQVEGLGGQGDEGHENEAAEHRVGN